MKTCSKCKINKIEEDFCKHSSSSDGLCSLCRICKREVDRIYRSNNEELCSIRKINYYIENKERLNKEMTQYYTENKATIRIKAKKYRIKNREYLSLKDKEKYLKNREKIILRVKNNYIKNRERILEKSNEYKKKRMEIDPIFKLRVNFSTAFRNALKARGLSKSNNSTFGILPYTKEQLKAHLESQFEPWMNWENYGGRLNNTRKTWHIDHKIAQSRLPYDSTEHPNFKICWALDNLRPLEKMENKIKGDKLINEDGQIVNEFSAA